MKKCIVFCVAIAILISCAACGDSNAPEVTQAPTVAPTQLHICTSPCALCGLCANENCASEVCAEKCTGVHWEEPHVFPTGDYITTEPVSIDTDTLVFDIGENVYVPGNLAEMGETVAVAIEKVTGLDFDGAGYAKGKFTDGKVHVSVLRDNLYVEQDWYQGLKTSEVGNAYAEAWGHVAMGPGDLFFGNSYAVIHELGHVLMFRQSEWSHCRTLNEGFAEYITYLVLQELGETRPELAVYLDWSEQTIANMNIWNYDALFEQPLEHWFENEFQYSGNGNYAVGFRFMSYLHDVYGDFSKWITEFEDTYSFNVYHTNTDSSNVQWQIQVLKETYGDDVLDNFYPWLRANLDRFNANHYFKGVQDLSGVNEVNWYPYFSSIDTTIRRERVQYEDLYINIDSIRNYLENYKGYDAGKLLLVTSKPVQVNLYHADGSYITVMTNSEKTENPIEVYKWEMGERFVGTMQCDGALSLDDISYIKLVGAEKLDWIEIVGDFRMLFE